MRKFLLGLSPTLVLVVGTLFGGITSTGIVGAGFWAWNTFIENPQIVAVTNAAADAKWQIKVLEAAIAAQAAERARQEAASDAALKAFREAAEVRLQLQEKIQDNLEQEIADNERKLAEEGRSCFADDADIQFIKGGVK